MWDIVRRTLLFTSAALFALSGGQALAGGHAHFVEPKLYVAKGGHATPNVALTFDACAGQADMRILNTLVDNRIPATIFVTGRWLKYNPEALAILKAHPDLFELENHGLDHVPAIDTQPTMFGLKTAGTLDAIHTEIAGGASAIETFAQVKPVWYRDATARYSDDAISLVHIMGYRVAGYSLNADMGALLPAEQVEKRLAAAKDGDVVIAHINQPARSAGAGVVKGILALKAKGFRFQRLEDVQESEKPLQSGV